LLARGRVIQLANDTPAAKGPSAKVLPGGHVVAGEITEAAVRARKIVADAQASATQERLNFEENIESIRSDLLNCARIDAESSLADKVLEVAGLRQLTIERAEDDIIALARVLAERIIGEELSLRPERILLLAKQCIREGRGSSRLLLCAHPDDAAYLRQQMDQLSMDDAVELQIQSEPDLMRGDLRVETDVGTIDARIGTQLANLAAKIRESFRV
jgi:flagellar biosynthesis/type III secretory pathway protein FliH